MTFSSLCGFSRVLNGVSIGFLRFSSNFLGLFYGGVRWGK